MVRYRGLESVMVIVGSPLSGRIGMDKLQLRVEQLILILARLNLTNEQYSAFVRSVILDIETDRKDLGLSPLSPNGWPPELQPKPEIKTKDWNPWNSILSLFKRKLK